MDIKDGGTLTELNVSRITHKKEYQEEHRNNHDDNQENNYSNNNKESQKETHKNNYDDLHRVFIKDCETTIDSSLFQVICFAFKRIIYFFKMINITFTSHFFVKFLLIPFALFIFHCFTKYHV